MRALTSARAADRPYLWHEPTRYRLSCNPPPTLCFHPAQYSSPGPRPLCPRQSERAAPARSTPAHSPLVQSPWAPLMAPQASATSPKTQSSSSSPESAPPSPASTATPLHSPGDDVQSRPSTTSPFPLATRLPAILLLAHPPRLPLRLSLLRQSSTRTILPHLHLRLSPLPPRLCAPAVPPSRLSKPSRTVQMPRKKQSRLTASQN